MSTQNYVFVLDTNRKPLNPCAPGVVRGLLKAGKARVFRRFPFVIILNKAVAPTPKPMQLKLDPGSKTTGIALVQEEKVVWGAELNHRGQQIKDAHASRRALRRGRRNRKTRYRQPRFLNRTRRIGWLPPSLQHRVETTLTWVKKLCCYAPVTGISQELVKFDLQQMENPEISGTEYQQGTLVGYEVREYLLEKWNRKCAYCGAENVLLQVEHIQPKAKGGTNRISNLCMSCIQCNFKKGTKDIKDFLKEKPDVLERILKQAKTPLKEATAVNATRWALFNALKQTGLPVEVGSGGKTKFNRCRFQFPKHHWIDAACVGNVAQIHLATKQPLIIQAKGHGTRQQCRTDKYGFPFRYVPRFKFVKGFQTGDIVKAVVKGGKKAGTYVGRVAVRSTGSFNIRSSTQLVQGINHKYCQPIHRKDGYEYFFSSDCVAHVDADFNPRVAFPPRSEDTGFPRFREVFMTND